jgi:probable HAF family extracellular repeat protein
MHGFLDTDGHLTPIDVPGSHDTRAYGINDSGQIVGDFEGQVPPYHGFVDTGGIFTTIDVPGAIQTFAFGINNSGQIVGLSPTVTGNPSFLYTDGNFTTINVPGASPVP